MPNRLNEVMEHLRRIMLLREGQHLSDGQLLDRFISHREAAVLEALVAKHGAMVWSVCYRLLRDHHETEDAFQATFLVFVRKVASIAQRDLLTNWLHGVAQQTALKARQKARRRRERPLADAPEPTVIDREPSFDLRPILDRELSRLPAKYRAAIILCDLEGKSRKEAAGELGIPEGTVASRLDRAREMLAKRLTRHGLAVTGATLAGILTQNAASAAVSRSLIVATVKAASLPMAGKAAVAGVVSANVAVLTQGVIQAMFISKLMKITLVLAVLGMAGFGGERMLRHQMAAGQTTLVQNGKSETKAAPQANAKTENAAMQEEIAKLRQELDKALREIKNLKETPGTTPKEPMPMYKGKPLSFWKDQLQDFDPKFRAEAVNAVGIIASKNKELIPLILAALKDKDYNVCWEASAALGKLGSEAVPGLLEVLKEKTPKNGFSPAVRALGLIGPEAKASVPFLAKLLKPGSWDDPRATEVRGYCIYSLGGIGPEAKPAIPQIIELYGDYLKNAQPMTPLFPGKFQGKKGKQNPVEGYDDSSVPFIAMYALLKIDPEIRKILPVEIQNFCGPGNVNNVNDGQFERFLAREFWEQAYEALTTKYQKEK